MSAAASRFAAALSLALTAGCAAPVPPALPDAACVAIASDFGRDDDMNGDRRSGLHGGIDFKAPRATPAIAAAPGTVVELQSNPNTRGGLAVVIHHGNAPDGREIWSYYGHLEDFRTAVGEKVSRGQIVGLVGNTGWSMPKWRHFHLHFEVYARAPDAGRRSIVNPHALWFPLGQAGRRIGPAAEAKDSGDAGFSGFTHPLPCDGWKSSAAGAISAR